MLRKNNEIEIIEVETAINRFEDLGSQEKDIINRLIEKFDKGIDLDQLDQTLKVFGV